ncbi:MAG: porin [Acidobacteriota bacterium]
MPSRVGLVVVLLGLAAGSAEAAGWSLKFDRRPRLRYGKLFQADFRVKMQADFMTVTEDPEADRDLFDFRRRRIGVEGEFLRHFDYELEYDFAEDDHPLRDAFVNFRRFRRFQVQGGKFKIPFGRDQLTRPTALDFVFRSYLGRQVAPAREVGLMLHGPVVRGALRYQFGAFRHDGENSYAAGNIPGGGTTWAARLRAEPADLLSLPKLLRNMEIAAAATWGNLPEGRSSLRGRTAFGETFFPRAFVRGKRLRWGTDLNWSPGPFSLQAEYMRSRDQRLGQSLRQRDLPDLVARGWYLSGTWVVTGEKKAGGVTPRKAFPWEGGVGAFELGVRHEFLRFGATGATGVVSTSPRATNPLPTSDRNCTFGVNWYLNRYARIQGNLIREMVESQYLDPGSPRQKFWTRVLRLQFVM